MRQFLFVLLIYTLSMANSTSSICDKDVKQIVYFYSLGDKYSYEKDVRNAIKSYEQTIVYTKKALKSCQSRPYYNENIIYSYMTSSEIKISNIKQNLN